MIQTFLHHEPQIHDSAWVHPMATIIGEVTLSEGVSIWPGAVLRGDMGGITIGKDSNVQDQAVVHMTGGISTTVVGDRVTVGHRALLHGCQIGNDCLIGMGAILLDNAVIPDGCLVGAGSLVTANKTFPSNTLILGSPAKVVRKLTDKDRKWIQYSWKHYQDTVAHYRATAQP
ncbi:MAG: gamma carbonic anhydrase family protein [Proteobacteria bacterium]|nr:gamma carbonic anhydrase family protein [Pseudomonadota bacterium]MCP4921606.1 gamma carbonic anhydrase family protein [Pseudomonadota bacterium]